MEKDHQKIILKGEYLDEKFSFHIDFFFFGRPLRESNGNDNSDKSDSETSSSTEMIEKINKAKDFYEVLGVSKNATVEEITKRYRKVWHHFQ